MFKLVFRNLSCTMESPGELKYIIDVQALFPEILIYCIWVLEL